MLRDQNYIRCHESKMTLKEAKQFRNFQAPKDGVVVTIGGFLTKEPGISTVRNIISVCEKDN